MKILCALLALASLAACSSGANGLNGKSSLVKIVPEGKGAHCAQGGVAIESGFDVNGNGTLDDSEVDASATQYVCNGATGATGGTGSTGATGDAGTNGSQVLVKVTTLGANNGHCDFGGTQVDVGLDTNHDGVLQTTEITSTSYVCQPDPLAHVYLGDITIDNPDDLSALDGVEILLGNLTIQEYDNNLNGDLVFPTLQIVTGTIEVDGPNGEFRRSGGGGEALRLADDPVPNAVSSYQFPSLAKAGRIGLYGSNASLGDFPLLQTAGGVDIEQNFSLATLNLPALQHVTHDALYLSSNELLPALSLPALTSVISLHLEFELSMTTLELPALATVQDDLYVRRPDLLTGLSFPALTRANSLTLADCANIASLSAPLLRSLPSALSLSSATKLPLCDLYALLGQLQTVPDQVDLAGAINPEACTATPALTLSIPGISSTSTLVEMFARTTFYAGEEDCAALGTGAHLAWFESADEWGAFKTAWAANDQAGAGWLGYTDEAVDGTWAVVSGFSGYNPAMPIDAGGFWNTGEPNGTTSENCAEVFSNGASPAAAVANDSACNNAYHAICRVPAQQ